MFKKLSIILGLALTAIAYFGVLFTDGLTVAKTQMQLSHAVEHHPERFMQFAASPLYQPLFTSYEQELTLLKLYLEGKNEAALANRLQRSALFKDVLAAEDESSRNEAARNLFLRLAHPVLDKNTIYAYETGKKISSSLGIKLPELKTS